MYDLIGDLHGHAGELARILEVLGYEPDGLVYRHPAGRQVVFLGDYIDRGPEIRRTLEIVRGMVERGHARAILGNHEVNALAFHTPDPGRPSEYLRAHIPKNVRQHQATLDQLAPAELANALKWFRTLPAWLDLGGVRAVHACWDDEHLSRFAAGLREHGGLTTGFLREAADKAGALFPAVDATLKGKEARLPAGVTFKDKDGHSRAEVRTRWYLPAAGHTYRTYALQSDEVDNDTPLTPQVVAAAHPYPVDGPPVFIGHYWLSVERPEPLARNVACLDYSVAKGGFLCAYRWDGERVIDPAKFVTAPADRAS
jgi:hypothetical protein